VQIAQSRLVGQDEAAKAMDAVNRDCVSLLHISALFLHYLGIIFCTVCVSRMRSEGFLFYFGGLGVESLFARRCFCVRNRLQLSSAPR